MEHDIPEPVLPPSRQEIEANERNRKDLLRVCRAFVEQSEKLRGFPEAHEPYAGLLSMARAAIRQAEELELYAGDN